MKRILYYATLLLLLGCQEITPRRIQDGVTVNFIYSERPTKSLDVDDGTISNCNIFVYDTNGDLVESVYSESGAVPSLSLMDAAGLSYRFYCVCNIGDITGNTIFSRETALANYQYSVSDYTGIINSSGTVPMTGRTPYLVISDGMDIQISLTRCVALVTIWIDDRNLENASIQINSITVRNVPLKVGLYGSSAAASPADCTPIGDTADNYELTRFNDGYEINFYLFENNQGVLLPANDDCHTKFFSDGSPYENICSYIELTGYYDNPSSADPRYGNFTYRFYLGGDSDSDFSVLRNHQYSIVLELTDDGVDEDSWRVDSDLTPYGSSRYPIMIRPNILALDGWMLGAGSGTDSFGVTVYYSDGTTDLLTEDYATGLICNGSEWNVAGEMLYAPNQTGELSLELEYSENGHTVYYESYGSVVEPDDFFTATFHPQVAKKYGQTSDTPVVISNIICYSDHEVELSDWLTFSVNNSLLEPCSSGYRLKGNTTTNGDIFCTLTGSLTDSFGNPFSKSMTHMSTIFEWRQRYYCVDINTVVREHIDVSYGSQEQPDNIIVTITLVRSWASDQFVNRYYFPASYDENGDLIGGYWSYNWYDEEIVQQMGDRRQYLFNYDSDGNILLEGYCYIDGSYIYYKPLY